MTKVSPRELAVLACAAIACRGQRAPADDGHAGGGVGQATRVAIDAGVAALAIDPARACGEPGPSATPLPPRLFDGMASVGDGTVQPDATVHVGGVEAKYSASAWIGSREHGHGGPSLALLIDRAEAGEGRPWGASVPLEARTTQRTFVGPYRIDVAASDEAPPKHVQVHVERRACPDHVVIPPPAGPTWVWASTEAIESFTVDPQGQLLQILVDASAPGPRLMVSTLGWNQAFVPVPGMTRTVRVDGRSVTIEAVEPGRGTRFDGAAWHADAGPPRFSVRARIDNVDAIPLASADVAAAPCGDAMAQRTTLPAALKAVPRVHATTTIAAAQHRTLDGIELDARTLRIPPARHGELPRASLFVSSDALDRGVSAGSPDDAVARAARALVTFEPVGSPATAFRVRTFPVACGRDLALPAPDAPVYVWLSSVGHTAITFGPAEAPALRLRLFVEPTTATLNATSPNAFDNRPVDARLVGHAVTLDGLLVQVTDVVITDAHTPFPITHVQVRVARP